MQRPAEEHDVAFDAPALRQSRDGLIDDRLVYGCGYIFFFCALVEQRLDVGFRKHAAAARDGIDALMLQRQFVQLFHGDIEQRGHLVDKGAGAACAAAVHALIHAAPEEDDLRVFSAQFHHDVRRGFQHLHHLAGSEDLLYERKACCFGKAQSGAAGDRRGKRSALQEALRLLGEFHRFLPHLGKMSFVFLKQDLSVLHDDDLRRGGPDVQAHQETLMLFTIFL